MIEFRFAHPLALMLLPISAAYLFFWLRGQGQKAPPVMRYSDTRLLDELPAGCRVRLRRFPDVLRAMIWIVLVVILARPQSGHTQEIIRGEGIDIVMVLDISGSMSSPDFLPLNRLEAAKAVISNFIAGRVYDRIGLVVFANDAYHQAPPTVDYRILQELLANVRLAQELGIMDGSALGRGIASAANMLRSSTAESKIIILLTDGDNNIGALDPITATQAASTFGARVYTIGMGRTGPITITDAEGNTDTVISTLDEATLRQIANNGHGVYFNATDTETLESVYTQIDRLERSQIERRVLIRWQDQFSFILMWFTLAFLLLERILRHTVFQTIP